MPIGEGVEARSGRRLKVVFGCGGFRPESFAPGGVDRDHCGVRSGWFRLADPLGFTRRLEFLTCFLTAWVGSVMGFDFLLERMS